MTPAEFRAELKGLGLSQVGFVREVAALGGEGLAIRTVQRWANDERAIPPLVPAVLTLLRERTNAGVRRA